MRTIVIKPNVFGFIEPDMVRTYRISKNRVKTGCISWNKPLGSDFIPSDDELRELYSPTKMTEKFGHTMDITSPQTDFDDFVLPIKFINREAQYGNKSFETSFEVKFRYGCVYVITKLFGQRLNLSLPLNTRDNYYQVASAINLTLYGYENPSMKELLESYDPDDDIIEKDEKYEYGRDYAGTREQRDDNHKPDEYSVLDEYVNTDENFEQDIITKNNNIKDEIGDDE